MTEVLAIVEGILSRSTEETRPSGRRPAVGASAPLPPAPPASPEVPPRAKTTQSARARSGRLRRLVRPRRSVLPLVAGASACLVLGAVSWSLVDRRGERPPEPSPPPPPASPEDPVPAAPRFEGPDLEAFHGAEPERARVRREVQLALSLAERERDFRRALGELDLLAARAAGIGVAAEVEAARASVAGAESAEYATYRRELERADRAEALEALLERHPLFLEARAVEIEEFRGRVAELRAASVPDRGPELATATERARALLEGRRYLEAWEVLEPLEARASEDPALFLRARRLGSFDRFVQAGGGPDSVAARIALPLERRIECARRAPDADPSSVELEILWARLEEKDPGFLDGYLATGPGEPDREILAVAVRSALASRFEDLRRSAGKAHEAPGPFLDAVRSFERALQSEPEFLEPYSLTLAAWEGAVQGARQKPSQLSDPIVLAHFAFGEGERVRPGSARDADGPVPSVHDQDASTVYRPDRTRTTIWIEFKGTRAIRVAGIELRVAAGVHRYALYAGDVVGARNPADLLAVEATVSPELRSIKGVPPGRPQESRLYTLVVECATGIAISEVCLIGVQHFEEILAVPDRPGPLRRGGTLRMKPMARFRYDPLGDLTEDNYRYAWRSDAWDVAVVDSLGVVTAIGPGTARITVELGGISSRSTAVEVRE